MYLHLNQRNDRHTYILWHGVIDDFDKDNANLAYLCMQRVILRDELFGRNNPVNSHILAIFHKIFRNIR